MLIKLLVIVTHNERKRTPLNITKENQIAFVRYINNFILFEQANKFYKNLQFKLEIPMTKIQQLRTFVLNTKYFANQSLLPYMKFF